MMVRLVMGEVGMGVDGKGGWLTYTSTVLSWSQV